jgi:hypothetical protein
VFHKASAGAGGQPTEVPYSIILGRIVGAVGSRSQRQRLLDQLIDEKQAADFCVDHVGHPLTQVQIIFLGEKAEPVRALRALERAVCHLGVQTAVDGGSGDRNGLSELLAGQFETE